MSSSSSSLSNSSPSSGHGTKRYIIFGDVHGCLIELQELVEKVGLNKINDVFISVGDLLDKGPDSPGVVRYMRGLREAGYNVVLVLGNHERKHERARKGKGSGATDAVIQSIIASLDAADVAFLESAVLYHKIEEPWLRALIVHAGIPPLAAGPLPPPFPTELKDRERQWEEMIRIRNVRSIEKTTYTLSISVRGDHSLQGLSQEEIAELIPTFLAATSGTSSSSSSSSASPSSSSASSATASAASSSCSSTASVSLPPAAAAPAREIKCVAKPQVRRVGTFVSLGDEEEDDVSWATMYDGRYGHVYFGHVPYVERTEPLEYPHATALDLCAVGGGHLCAAVLEEGKAREYVLVKAKRAYVVKEAKE